MTQAFTTPEDRAVVLQGVRDGEAVPLGTSMTHARATKLGPWGDPTKLRQDCLTLLIGEMRTAGVKTPSQVYVTGTGMRLPLKEAIASTAAFSLTYKHARFTNELKAENDLRSALGHETVTWSPPDGVPVEDHLLAQAVGEELRL